MRPLLALSAEVARGLSGVLFDLDDTLLDDGRLTEEAYGALWRMSRAGLRLLVVTGRPASWGEVMARQWPIDAAVTENGAVVLCRNGHAVLRHEAVDPATREARQARLSTVLQALRERFPEARLSDDAPGRVSDVTLDIGESQRVRPDVVDAMIATAHELGVRTTTSSVHLHLTLDPLDKASGAVAFLAAQYGEDPTAVRSRYAFVGDSANDAACFFAFSPSFGVANVRRSANRISVLPEYAASREKGAGFAEIADRILTLRADVWQQAP
jgi:HAD superfamily hydrolase (TIGR01484 family)